jgi:putative nucleotidyltransferase with HDIG domain
VENGSFHAIAVLSYQPFAKPETLARANKAFKMPIPNTPDLETDGLATIYPFWGAFKSMSPRRLLLAAAGRRIASRRATSLIIYAVVLGAGASGAFIALVISGQMLGNIWVILALAIAAAAAERQTVAISSSTEVSVGLLPALFAAVVFGPLAALLISAASMLSDLRPRADVPLPYLKWVIYTSSRSITSVAAGLAAVGAEAIGGNGVAGIGLATSFAAVTLEMLDIFFFSLTMRFRGHDVREGLRVLLPVKLSSLPFFIPVVGLLAFCYAEISPWTLPLFLVPAFAAQQLFILYQNQRELTDNLVNLNARLERANLSFAATLVATLDARDRYTAGHSTAVARYAKQIANRMNLSEDRQELAHLCGLVHDIGKVGLPTGLLEKPGPLTLYERRQMERHSAIGEMILGNMADYSEIAQVVRHHHERVDGRGYPDGLVGEEIPLLSRIIAVADAFDAMTSDRPYRDAMPDRLARFRLAQAVDTQFDTSVVAAFEAILATGCTGFTGRSDEAELANHLPHPEFGHRGAA